MMQYDPEEVIQDLSHQLSVVMAENSKLRSALRQAEAATTQLAGALRAAAETASASCSVPGREEQQQPE